MTITPFIQIGQWVFATAHIAAINLDDATSTFHPCVSLRIVGDNDPWLFRLDTPEADAIIAFAKTLIHNNDLCN